MATATLMLLLADSAYAQAAYYQADDMQEEAPDASYQATPSYSQEQLAQMLAPIALYPDPLLGQILMASTYPLQVVEASRWRQDPANSTLSGDALVSAVYQQPWDASVKSLAAFPTVLQMLDTNLAWTQQLGNAFAAQQPEVMDMVQQLRLRALSAGTLASTPQQTVQNQGGVITIEPASADTVYPPYYNSAMAYGVWPYPEDAPYYIAPPYGYYYDGGLIGFGAGLDVFSPLWGWNHWDWNHHRITVNQQENRGGNASGVWHNHSTYQYRAPVAIPNGNYRSYAPVRQPIEQTPRASLPAQAPQGLVRNYAPADVARPQMEPMARPAPPVFESFSRGAQVQSYAARGMESRASMGGGARTASASPARGNEGERR